MTFLQDALPLLRVSGVDVLPGRPEIAVSGETFTARFRQHDFSKGVIRLEIRPGELPTEDMLQSLGLVPATPFQNPGWLEAWQRAAGPGNSSHPVTVIGYSGKTPLFALPLAVTRKFGLRLLTWYSSQLSDYCAPVVAPGFAAAAAAIDGQSILARIAEAIGGIDLVHLTKNPVRIDGASNPFVLADSMAYHARAHAIMFGEHASFEAFYTARRSTKTRRRIKEKLNALEKTGAVGFRFAQTVEEAQRIASACIAAKSRQLRENGHWDPFSDTAVRDFVVSSFAADVGNTTWACSLSAGDEVLATSIGFRNGRNWLLYQMSMEDTGKERFSPGTHLLMNLMKRCFAENAAELDLALGDESYKAEWCDADRDLMISALAITPRGRLLARLMSLRATIMARLSSDHRLHARAKRIQNIARKLRIPV